MDDLQGVDLEATSMEFGETDVLPAVCSQCGEPTERVIKFRTKSKLTGLFDAIAEFLSLFYMYRYLDPTPDTKRATIIIRLKIPCCKDCENKCGQLKVKFIDLERFKVTLQVHEKFKEAVFRGKKNSG